jgi:hypothetical protein
VSEHNGNGNGHVNGNGHTNGNGNGGVFGLHAKEDPMLTKFVPQSRREVFHNKKVSVGVRMFYAYLTDFSLFPGVCTRRGVYSESNTTIAQRLGVSTRTIQNWKSELVALGKICITEKWQKHSYPKTVYNIVDIVGQAPLPMAIESEDGSAPEDEIFTASNRRRSKMIRGESGKWKKPVGGSKSLETPISRFLAENPAHQDNPNQNLPASHETDCAAPAQLDARHQRNTLRAAHEPDCVPAAQPSSLVARTPLRGTHEPDCAGPTKPVADNREIRTLNSEGNGESLKRSTGLNASKMAGRDQKTGSEELFLLDVAAEFERWKKGSAKAEMIQSGAFYRLCYRKNPDLARRVLAEVHSAIMEMRIKDNPGACFIYNWQDLDGGEVNMEVATAASKKRAERRAVA